MTDAIVITGAPGAGKSSVAQALTTLLDDAGFEHGAIESEVLPRGSLERVVADHRRCGGRLLVVVATTETQADLEAVVEAIGAERTLVACLRAPGEVCAARVLEREPQRWAGREPLAAHARVLAGVIPSLPGVGLVLDTDGRGEETVAGELFETYVNGGWVGSG